MRANTLNFLQRLVAERQLACRASAQARYRAWCVFPRTHALAQHRKFALTRGAQFAGYSALLRDQFGRLRLTACVCIGCIAGRHSLGLSADFNRQTFFA
jgi:hypothetical protein